jgi:hypothetical protein
MLVDVVVKRGEIIGAKPTSEVAAPIIMIELVDGVRCPTIKWRSGSCDTLRERLQNRTYGRLKGKAMEKAYNVVMGNGELNISGEYGSIEIDDKDFEVDLELQKEFIASLALSKF